jgi:hypothetical protein
MAMTKCKECGGELSTKAEACPKCGAKVRRTSIAAWGCLGLLAFLAVSAVIGGMFGVGSTSSSIVTQQSSGTSGNYPDAAGRTSSAAVDPSTERLTPAQRNAVRSARAYLNMSGFSRRGLIDQLSSDYGEQYSVADATVAVDFLNVDWNAQASRSATAYLKMSGFSCQGLIDQLSSSYGEKYTVGQATYGAKQAGIC